VAAVKPGVADKAATGPHYAFGSFEIKQAGDTFLDVSALGKGALWINGHALGRYWNEGPQKTLYLPGPWLREGTNRVVVFDIFDAPGKQELQGRTKPILDAPIVNAPIVAEKLPVKK